MPWVIFTEGGYRLRLLDGYLTTPKAPEWRAEMKRKSLERVALECLAKSTRRAYRPDPFNIWIVGSDSGVSNTLAAPISTIAEGDRHSYYRMIIFGYENTQTVSAFESGFPWDRVVRDAGLTRRKRHSNLPIFRAAAHQLLYSMYQYYQSDLNPMLALQNHKSAYEHRSAHR